MKKLENMSNSGNNEPVFRVEDDEEDQIIVSFLDAVRDGNDEGVSSIYEAADKKFKQKLLLCHDNQQNTALHLACRRGHADIVKYLVEQAEEISEEFQDTVVSLRNNKDFTPMLEACIKGYETSSKAAEAKEPRL